MVSGQKYVFSHLIWLVVNVVNVNIHEFINVHYFFFTSDTSSAAQGGGGSFKNRKPIREVGCCESGMAERSH